MFSKKNTYMFATMNQSEEAFNALCNVFNTFGSIKNLEKRDLVETANPENQICEMLVFTLEMKSRKFNKMIKGFINSGHHPKEIKGYWFM